MKETNMADLFQCPVLAGDPYAPMRCRVELSRDQMQEIDTYHDEVVEETHESGHEFVLPSGAVMLMDGWIAMVSIESPEYWLVVPSVNVDG